MSKFNFNSQVATSRVQSERLLALGLKKETADMCSVIDHVSDGGKWEVWSPVFDNIFSERCSRIVYKLLPNFNPYIPDTTYGADVMGFWREFEDTMNNIKVV